MFVAIPAGGLGTRIRDHIGGRPKLLAPLLEETFLQHQIRSLSAGGATHLHYCLGYQSGAIIEALSATEMADVRVTWSVEHEPLGVLGAVAAVERDWTEPLCVVYGDVIPPLPVSDVLSQMLSDSQAEAGISVFNSPAAIEVNNLIVDNGLVRGFHPSDSTLANRLDVGVLSFAGPVLRRFDRRPLSEDDVLPVLCRDSRVVAIEAQNAPLGVGDPQKYRSFLQQLGVSE